MNEQIKEAADRIEQLEAQLANALEELERWRRMAAAVTPILRAIIGEDEYARIMGSPASPRPKGLT